MFHRFVIVTSIITLAFSVGCAQAVESNKVGVDHTEAGFVQIFNGRDLTGWDGEPRFWSVKDGVIVAQVNPGIPVKNHSYLLWQGGKVRDFELHVTLRSTVGNSGIDYRADHVPTDRDGQPLKWTIRGYQHDIAKGWMGSLYNWGKTGAQPGKFIVVSGDGIVTKHIGSVADRQVLSEVGYYKPNDWNEFVIIARGSHILHRINDYPVVEFIDNSRDARRQGVLGLQVHSGRGPFLNEFKEIRIRKFKDSFGQARLLFNGEDLSGWIFSRDEAENQWCVENGLLVNKGRSQGHPTPYIRTKGVYTNYVLRFQYRKPGEQESAVLLRFADSGQAHPKGIRVSGKGNDFNCVQSVGDFAPALLERLAPLAFKPMPPNFWNECEITLNKGQLEVRVNGVLRATGTGCSQTPGKIGFETGGSRIEYRNIVLIPILSDRDKSEIITD